MPKFIDRSDFEKITTVVMDEIINSGLIGVFIGYVSHNDTHLPTHRPDGTPIMNNDYVRPAPSSIFSFTLDGITFINRFNIATYSKGSWILDTSIIPNTGEIPVLNPAEESISGNVTTQNEINKEVKRRFSYVHDQNIPQQIWNVSHNLGYIPSVTIIDNNGHRCIADVVYNDLNNLTITFSALVGGHAYLS